MPDNRLKNAAVSASVESTKWDVTTRYSEKTNHLITSGFSRPQQAFKRYELVSQVPGKTL